MADRSQATSSFDKRPAEVTAQQHGRTEEAVQKSEGRYRQMLSLMPAAVYSCDASGLITYYNERAAQLWGRAPAPGDTDERFCGSEQLTLPDGRPLPHEECPMAIALREGRSFRDAEVNIRRPDGSSVPVMVNIDAIFDEEGAVVGAINVFYDISAIKRANEARRLSEERFRAFTSATSDVVCRMSPDWREMRELHGRGFMVDTLEPSRSWIDKYLHPDDQQAVLQAIHRAVHSKSVFELEHRIIRADGSLGWAYSRSIPIFDDSGEIIEWFGVATDVTRRKEAEQALRESEERFRMVADNMDQLAWTCDTLGNVTWYNRRWLDYTGLSFEEMKGWNWSKVQHPNHLARVVERIRRSAETGEPWEDTFPLRGKDGQYRWFLSRALPIHADGRIVRWFGTNTDVTEQLAAEEALREANRHKDEFIAMLAHELRNPLTPIRTGLELIRISGDTPEAVARVRAIMERQVGHMVRLIDDLLDVSRITSGRIELQRKPTAIGEIVNGAIEANRAAAAAGQLKLTATGADLPLYLNVDPTRFIQILSNVVHNATKFTPPGGTVSIGVEVVEAAGASGGQSLVIKVTDTGAGIAKEMLPRLFDLFTQGAPSSHGSHAGLGIGLALARQLIEMHGGRIEALSEGPGHGSEFVISLPLDGNVAAEPSPARNDGPRKLTSRVVVIDDNEDAGQAVAMLIEQLGGEARVASDAVSGIQIIRQFLPDVVLLDIGMPGMDGYEACRRLRREPFGSDIFIVAFSGWGQEKDKMEALAAGFDAHLTKPADPVDLEVILEQDRNRSSTRRASPGTPRARPL